MTEQVFVVADKLSEVITNMQKCLRCPICLHTISDPVRTRCGHRFCRACIQTVLKSKKAHCPLCNSVMQRRNITNDEHMVQYIDRLQKLIESIQQDSGIDILSHISKRCNTLEGCSSNKTVDPYEFRAAVKPSCSRETTSLQAKWPAPLSKRGKRSGPRTKDNLKGKKRIEKKKGSNSMKYLEGFGMSGVEPLDLDEQSDYPDKKSTRDKVHSWLETLPNSETLDDPDRVALVQSETSLDETLIISVSQNCDNNKLEDFDNDAEVIVEKVIQSKEAHLKNESASNDRGDRRGSSETRIVQNSVYKTEFDAEHPVPSTSGINRSKDEGKEKGQDKTGDMFSKTSPCDMLPNMKHNWSSVVKFGKEMRTRKKKKLKSLSVSIENKGKTRTSDEHARRSSNAESFESRKVEPAEHDKRTKKGNEIGVSVNVIKTICLDDGNLGVETSPKKIKDNVEKEMSPKKRKNRSLSQESQSRDESSFIMLEEGKQVHIRNLNSCQMNAILGLTNEDRRAEDAASSREEIAEPTRTRVNPSNASLPDRSKMLPQMTPGRPVRIQGQEDPIKGLSDRRDDSSLNATKGNETIDDSCSAVKLQQSVSSRKRLSLKRRSDEAKSNELPNSNADSRLQAVRRDLNREIEQSREVAGSGKRNTEEAVVVEQNMPSGSNKQDGRRIESSIATSSVCKSESKAENRLMVRFKKLGKVYKHRKKRVSFFYLGRTRQNTMVDHGNPELKFQKLCNLVDIWETQAMEDRSPTKDGFGNNVLVTVNEPSTMELDEARDVPMKEIESVAKDINILEIKGDASNSRIDAHVEPCTSKEIASVGNTVNNILSKGEEIDVWLVSSDEDDQTNLTCIERSKNASKSTPKKTIEIAHKNTTKIAPKNTPSKSIRMLSPTEDSQLKFLSLNSPTMENATTQKRIYEPEPTNCSTPKKSSFSSESGPSRILARISEASYSSDSPCTPTKKKKLSTVQEMITSTMKNENDDRDSVHSFSSQATVYSAQKKNSTSDKCHLSNPSTKDIEVVSLNTNSDIVASGRKGPKKAYKRIVPLSSSDKDSLDTVRVNNPPNNDQPRVSPTSKRKRVVSSDSDTEDLDVIVRNWYEESRPSLERCKKKGKLEQPTVRESSYNSMNASREAKHNVSLASCSADRNKPANKLSNFQRRYPFENLDKSSVEKSNLARSKWRRIVESRDAQNLDEDSPDFGSTIDKVKDLWSKELVPEGKQRVVKNESLMHDNFDEVLANVDAEALVDECIPTKTESKLVDRPRIVGDRVKKSKQNGSSVACSNNSNGSNKENNQRIRGSFCDSNADGDEDRNLNAMRGSAVDKSLQKNKIQERATLIESTDKHSMVIEVNENPENDSIVKDTYDSLLDITQHYLMIKQFEEDLLGKPKSSNVSPAKELKTAQKSMKNKEHSSGNDADVEHSAEEDDDIVENTPDRKTKNTQSIGSSQENSIPPSPIAKIQLKPFPFKTPSSTTDRSSSSTNTMFSKKSLHPLYQSTPKAYHSNARKCLDTSNKSPLDVVKEPFNRRSSNLVKNVVEVARNVRSTSTNQRNLCFVCSGLVASKIEQVKRLAQMLDGRYVKQFVPEVTHVIVTVNKENNGTNKTLKYLQGIAHRKWVVGYQWVVDSLKELRLVNEEPYEAVDCRTLEAGPRKSRLRQKDLFEGLVFLCIGPFSGVSVDEYKDLLHAMGAIVVDSLTALATDKRKLKIIVIQSDVYEFEVIDWYKEARAVPVVHDWVVECISQYKLISFYPYMQELARQDVLALGFPEYLVEEEAETDSDSVCDVSPP